MSDTAMTERVEMLDGHLGAGDIGGPDHSVLALDLLLRLENYGHLRDLELGEQLQVGLAHSHQNRSRDLGPARPLDEEGAVVAVLDALVAEDQEVVAELRGLPLDPVEN